MQYNILIIYKESAIKMIFFLILYTEYKDDVKSLFTEDVCGLLKPEVSIITLLSQILKRKSSNILVWVTPG